MSMTAVKTVLGTMTMGSQGYASLNNEQSDELLVEFARRGYDEIDTALVYGNGDTEVVLGQLGATKRFTTATKANPWWNGESCIPPQNLQTSNHGLSATGLAQQMEASLKSLQTDQVDIYYLHLPDRGVPIEETLEAINQAYEAKKFKRFGISNYTAWQVVQICEICKHRGWVQPTVYQGMYNVFARGCEQELIPVLRLYGLAFYGYGPIAGGLFSGKYQRDVDPESGRYDPKTSVGKSYRKRFFRDIIFDALEGLKPLLEKHDVTLLQAAIRWVYYHSVLSAEHGDAVLMGARSMDHLTSNLDAVEQGPLPEEIATAMTAIGDNELASKYPLYFPF